MYDFHLDLHIRELCEAIDQEEDNSNLSIQGQRNLRTSVSVIYTFGRRQ